MRGVGWSSLNPRQPWVWPAFWQRVSLAFAIVAGTLLIAPWWLTAWDAYSEAQQSAQTLARTQADIRNAQLRRAQLDQDLAQRLVETSVLVKNVSAELPVVSQALTRLAERESLALTLVVITESLTNADAEVRSLSVSSACPASGTNNAPTRMHAAVSLVFICCLSNVKK